MFQIKITVEGFQSLFGVESLDLRRRLGLTEALMMSHDGGRSTAQAPVLEGFARIHFPHDSIVQSRAVPLDILSKGDLVEKDPGGTIDTIGSVRLAPDIPPHRIEELWLAADERVKVKQRMTAFHQLQDKIKELEARLAHKGEPVMVRGEAEQYPPVSMHEAFDQMAEAIILVDGYRGWDSSLAAEKARNAVRLARWAYGSAVGELMTPHETA